MAQTKDTIKNPQRTITNYLDNEYTDYGMYTIQNRAIPSVIDGFKPTQRKIIFVADKIWKGGNDKPLKVFQFSGRIAADAQYHHSDASLNSAIINMAQSFKNSIPLLDSIGQFGSLRAPEAGAPRYISTKLNENFRLLYKDFELLQKQEEEGQEIEPTFFLPIIPTVLLNGSSGIAVGFSTNILNRNPIDIIEYCLNVLNDKKLKEPLPWIRDFKGSVQKIEDTNSYLIKGTYEIKNTNTVEINELPPSMTYQKFESHLNTLQEKGHIQYYDDLCNKNEIKYIIKFQRADLAERIKKGNLENLLKIAETESENLTCLNEHGKLIIFKTVNELIDYFVKFRLEFYDKRKQFIIDKLEKTIELLYNRARFIKEIIEGKLTINNKPKSQIIEQLEEKKYKKISDSFDYLLNMPIHTLTKEKYEELISNLSFNKEQKQKIENDIPIEMYKRDLIELKSALKK